MLPPPLIVPAGLDDDGPLIIEAISSYLTSSSTTSSSSPDQRPPESDPCPEEIITDLRRLVCVREEIIYAVENVDFDNGVDSDANLWNTVLTSLKEYIGLLGALLSVGIGSEDHISGLEMKWNVVASSPPPRGGQAAAAAASGGASSGGSISDDDNCADMEIDDGYTISANNGRRGPPPQHIITISSFRQERHLATYLLAALQYQYATTNLDSASARPANSATSVLSDMVGARDALKKAQLGFGYCAALMEHLRLNLEGERMEEEASGDGGQGGGGGNGNDIRGGGADCTLAGDTLAATVRLPQDQSSSTGGGAVASTNPCSTTSILDPSTLHLFHLLALSSGQTCFYYTALLQRKQMHSVLAKLAAGCADWYDRVATHARGMTDTDAVGPINGTARTSMQVDGGGAPTCADTNLRSWMPNKVQIRSTYQAAECYYISLAEYHEACVARGKKAFGAEVGRLRHSLELVGRAESELLGRGSHQLGEGDLDAAGTEDGAVAALLAADPTLRGTAALIIQARILAKIVGLHSELLNLLGTAEGTNNGGDVPAEMDIPGTRGQNMMKSLPAIPPEIDLDDVGLAADTLDPVPLEHILDQDAVQVCVDFHAKLRENLESAKATARNATDVARETLGRLGLPDSVMTFKATVEALQATRSSAGGQRGIPPAMATQINVLHSSNGVVLLKQNLYILQEVAELARQNLDEVEDMLNETARLDGDFRRDNPSFRGRMVDAEHEKITLPSFENSEATEVGARNIVVKCRNWLDQAHQGDEKLAKVLAEFESDPKYKLVMLPIAQLEKLVQGGTKRLSSNEDDMDDDIEDSVETVDTASLERSIAQLDDILDERDRMLPAMQKEVEEFRLRPLMVRAAANSTASYDDGLYLSVAEQSFPLFHHHIDRLNESIQEQQELLEKILPLNAQFQADRAAFEQEQKSVESSASSAASTPVHKAYLSKIASALTTIEWIQPQLIQGRNFYQTVLSHIDELKKKVSDVNAVLASERIFFEDSTQSLQIGEMRRRQEEEDERLARELSREAENAMQQGATMNSEQMQKDEEMAAELARQFREEANVSNGTINESGATSLARGDGNEAPSRPAQRTISGGRPQQQNSYFGGRIPPNQLREVDNVANALGISNERSEAGGDRDNVRMARQPSSNSLGGGDDRDRRRQFQQQQQQQQEQRRRSLDSFIGDVPREIFATNRGGGGSTGQLSVLSLEDVSTIGSESVIRTYQRRQQQQRQQQRQRNRHETALVPPAFPSRPTTRPERSTSDDDVINESLSDSPTRRSALPGRSSRPGMVQMKNDEIPEVDVNDQAFAQLVSMDFDPDVVRDALQRFDNNVERATEWILTKM